MNEGMYDKPNLEARIREVLDADFPEWIWNLKKGDHIAVESYQGSWNQPGSQIWFEKIFICIAGNKLWYQSLDNPMQITYTSWANSVKTMREFKLIQAQLLDYRNQNPNWAEDIIVSNMVPKNLGGLSS